MRFVHSENIGKMFRMFKAYVKIYNLTIVVTL